MNHSVQNLKERNPGSETPQVSRTTLTARATAPRLYSLHQQIARTTHAARPHPQNMRVDHGRRHIAMPQKLLHGPDIRAAFEQVRGKGMSKRVTGHALGNFRLDRCTAHRPLHRRLVQMMPPFGSFFVIDPTRRRRKDPLPDPLAIGVRKLPRDRVRQPHPPKPARQIALTQVTSFLQLIAQRLDRIVARSRLPFGSRAMICRREKSRSLTRNRRHSSSRSPDPYSSKPATCSEPVR